MTAGCDSHNEPSRTGRSSASGRTISDSFALKLAVVISLADPLAGRVYLTHTIGRTARAGRDNFAREPFQGTSADAHHWTLRVICLHARQS